MPTHYIPNSPRKGVKGGEGRGGKGSKPEGWPFANFVV